MAQKIVYEIDVKTGKSQKEVQDLNEDIKDTGSELQGVGDIADKATGGLVTKFKGVASGVKGATTSLKGLRVAIIATGIGAFVLAIGALATNFTNGEEGANRLNKILKTIGVVAGNVTDIFYNLGQAVFGLVTGNFDLMNQAFDEAIGKIKNFNEETQREIELQGNLADEQARLIKLERELTVERAKADRDRAELLDKAADKERFTASERIAFLKEAARIDEQITNQEIEAAQIRLKIREQENSLSVSSTEDLNEEARLKAELIQLETQRLTKQKTVTAQITSALREEQTEVKALVTERKNEIKEFESDRKELESILSNSIVTNEELQIQANQNVAQGLRDLNKYKDDSAKQDVEREKLTNKEKLAATAQALGGIIQLVGSNSKFGKSIAIVQAIRDTFAGANKALAQGGLFGAIGAAGIVASGIANVKRITSTPEPTAPSGISIKGGTSSASISAPSLPPAFTTVGTSGINQLAETIQGQAQKPIKAFVVSSEVTTAQSLDRNIVKEAGI